MEENQNNQNKNEEYDPDEIEEYSEEESSCTGCASSNYPDFMLEPDRESLEMGIKEGSYVLGFASSLNVLGLSETSLMNIILSKIDFGHQKELLRMQTASEERKAELWSKSKATFIDTGGID